MKKFLIAVAVVVLVIVGFVLKEYFVLLEGGKVFQQKLSLIDKGEYSLPLGFEALSADCQLAEIFSNCLMPKLERLLALNLSPFELVVITETVTKTSIRLKKEYAQLYSDKLNVLVRSSSEFAKLLLMIHSKAKTFDFHVDDVPLFKAEQIVLKETLQKASNLQSTTKEVCESNYDKLTDDNKQWCLLLI